MTETNAFERRARRLLRRMANGGQLSRSADATYVLSGKQGKSEGRPLAADFVAGLSARNWLCDANGVLVLSETGSAWLKRQEAGEDRFAAQHRLLSTRLIKDDRGRDCYVVVNAAESPLAALIQRKLIDPLQYEAGERLRRDFTLAQLTGRMGVDYSAPVGRRSHRPEALVADTALAARQRFNRAMTAAGPGLRDVLFDVCCYLYGLEECERLHNWPRASARVVLRIALDRLAEHYGLQARSSSPIRSWSKED
jgi:hypothetical protein